MKKDRYEFKNPDAGDWNNYEFNVRDVPESSVLTFPREYWDIEHTITITLKPKPIKPGQVWTSQVGNSKTVRHIYFDDSVQENVIVFQHPDNTWSALPEHTFRQVYTKDSDQ